MPHRLPPRIIRRRKRFLWGSFFLLAGGALAWTLFFTPLLTIKAVAVEGLETIRRDDLKEVLGEAVFPKTNILFFSPSRAAERIAGRFPQALTVNVKRTVIHFPPLAKEDFFVNAVNVAIAERKSLGVACRERCFAFDGEGVLFGESAQSSTTPFVLDQRASSAAYGLRERVFSPALVERLVWLLNTFSRASPGAERLEVKDYETAVVTKEGWSFIFANDRLAQEQYEAAEAVLAREIGSRRAELEYIDTTIKNRVYYRYRQ